MGLYQHPYNNEQREVSGAVASFLVNKGWTEVVPVEVIEEQAEAVAEELKGKDLDDALRANGLPLTGRVDEKRERLAAKLAESGQFGYIDDSVITTVVIDDSTELVDAIDSSPDSSQTQQSNSAHEEQS